jgi:hypothetical protein
MTRRDWFQWLALGSTSAAAKKNPERCVTPAYAGFDGSFVMNSHNLRRHVVKLARCYVDSPGRWSIGKGVLGCWKNRDESVSKVLYRNRDGKLFELHFVPMEEPA